MERPDDTGYDWAELEEEPHGRGFLSLTWVDAVVLAGSLACLALALLRMQGE